MKTKERGGAHPGIEGYGRPPIGGRWLSLSLSVQGTTKKKNLGGRSPKRVRTFQKSLVFSSFSSFMGRPSIFKEGGETTSTRPPTNYLHTRAGFCFQSGTEYQDVNRVDDYHLAPYFHRPICFRSNGFRVGQGLSLSLSLLHRLRYAPSVTADRQPRSNNKRAMFPIRWNGFRRRSGILALDSPEDVVQFLSPLFPFGKGLSCIV